MTAHASGCSSAAILDRAHGCAPAATMTDRLADLARGATVESR